MGTIIKLLLIAGFIFVGYQYFGDEIKGKVTDLQARTYEVVNPEGKRADLLEDLDIKIREIGEIRHDLDKIDLDKITDPEIKEILEDIKERASKSVIEELDEVVDRIQELNDKDGPIIRTITKIVEVMIPNNDPTPTPETQNEINSTPTPSSPPPASQCNWVCE